MLNKADRASRDGPHLAMGLPDMGHPIEAVRSDLDGAVLLGLFGGRRCLFAEIGFNDWL